VKPATGYEAYVAARDAVLRMKAVAVGGVADPSAYWAEELANIDYLIDASPLVVAKLRHHAFHITGIRPYDYRAQDGARREAFEARLRVLVELGGLELLVPEHEALGGFGYDLPEGLFNLDTIKYFEVLVGMKRAGVLDALAAQTERPTVLEIGAGWGGFTYQMKTLCPEARYVIVDFPELFLFSATYLQTVFPGASVAFVDNETAGDAVNDADIVFIPNTLADRAVNYAPDVTVNVASFQEMTSAQVSAYAALAHHARCARLYSLNRERSGHNRELSSVSECLARYYALEEITLLDTDYVKAMKASPVRRVAAGTTPVRGGLAYRHLSGTRNAEVAAQAPTIGIGLTAHNRAGYLRRALDSLRGQTRTDFTLVIVDDGSDDETPAIGLEYQALDSRIRYVRHEVRHGMTASWRHAFEAATAEPSVQLFAWASDHDVWQSEWLAALVGEFDHSEAVLAYPYTRRIDEQDAVLDKPARRFETAGMADLDARWAFICGGAVASGDMVYGLMKVDAARRAGVFRDVVCPDRLLMAELALQGEFRQVPRELWYRRQFHGSEGSVVRQRSSLFAGRVPSGRWLPPWAQHGRSLWRHYVQAAGTRKERRRRMRRVLNYCLVYALKHHRKTTVHRRLGAVLKAVRWSWKRAKHYVLLAVFHTLVSARRACHRTVFQVATFTKRIGLR
jgi:glycosyltransferase involved in cell wall biosynthesis